MVCSGYASEGQSVAAMSVCKSQGVSHNQGRSWGPHALKDMCLSHAAMKQRLSLLHVYSACFIRPLCLMLVCRKAVMIVDTMPQGVLQ